MSKTFQATAELGPDGKGKLSLGSDYNRARFAEFLKTNIGIRLRIEAFTPESREQRGFFEGGLVPFICYFQENIDYNDGDHIRRVRDWLMLEFNASFLTVGGKALKVAKSSKGELSRGLMERIMDWCGEQGYPIELLTPSDYKDWRDRVRPSAGQGSYLDYLVECGKLRPKNEYRV
jgi:hypothetical protein